jgi:hypothetical protein
MVTQSRFSLFETVIMDVLWEKRLEIRKLLHVFRAIIIMAFTALYYHRQPTQHIVLLLFP